MTDTTTNTQEDTTKWPTVFALRIVGHLGHDNKLFDRTCATCKGYYSSKLIATCPRCGKPLTYITTRKGKPMAISEGSIYPALWPKRKKEDLEAIGNRKNGMVPKYRFKTFSFADENGVLAPPTDHYKMLKGAQVDLTVINHGLIPSWFQTKEEKDVHVELMIQIYPHYGDKIKVTKPPKSAENTTAVPLDAAGHPVTPDVSTMQATIDALNAKIAVMEGTATVPDAIPTNAPVNDSVAQAAADAAAAASFTEVGGAIDPVEAVAGMDAQPGDVDPFGGV
jgi:hypothetical protein